MRHVIGIALVLSVIAFSSASCPCLIPKLNVPGEVTNNCSPEVVFGYSMRCVILATSERQCVIDGELTNTGDGTASGVNVEVDWKYTGELFFYQPPWPPVDDLPPHGSATFEAVYLGYSYPSGCNISISCEGYY